MSRFTCFAMCLLLSGGAASAQTTIPVDVLSAYLHLDPADLANPAQPIDLASMGLVPGYVIGLECAGDWNAGPGGDVQTNLLGVFSSDASLLAPSLLHRVPGAIDGGSYNFSGSTWPGGEPTDIPEDFLIGRPGISIKIPPGATRLFVTPADIYYRDNSDPDGDLGVTITLISTASVPAGGPNSQHLKLSAQPNPFTAASSITFATAGAANMRLTVHDLTGRAVRTLVTGSLQPGSHLERWDGRDASGRRVPAGIYFARLEGGVRPETTRLVLLP